MFLDSLAANTSSSARLWKVFPFRTGHFFFVDNALKFRTKDQPSQPYRALSPCARTALG